MKKMLGEVLEMTYNASSKARDDVNLFALELGYNMVAVNDKRNIHNQFGKVIKTIKQILELTKKIDDEDLVLVQCSFRVLPLINFIKKIRKFKMIYLIHDIGSLRDDFGNKRKIEKELKLINNSEYVICHNSSMKNVLINAGVRANIKVLEIFDYYIDQPNTKSREYGNTIVFAGNLSRNKSRFLYSEEFFKLSTPINVYGKLDAELPENVNYMGKYDPSLLPNKIIGNWGLVWEGDYDEYISNPNSYIKFNNPHKVSLYIAANLPIIIWKGAALAKYVEENNIGILIDSLDDLNVKINKVSVEEYNIKQRNIRKLNGKVTNGYYLKKVLMDIEMEIANK